MEGDEDLMEERVSEVVLGNERGWRLSILRRGERMVTSNASWARIRIMSLEY